MRRAIGLLLILTGLSPLTAAVWLGSQHIDTIGLAMDTRGTVTLTLLALIDLGLIAGGIFLLFRSN